MLLGYDQDDRNKIVSVSKGTGGYAEFMDQLVDDAILYGAVRVTAVDDDSRRTKFIFVCWIGSKVSPMQRARVSTHKVRGGGGGVEEEIPISIIYYI